MDRLQDRPVERPHQVDHPLDHPVAHTQDRLVVDQLLDRPEDHTRDHRADRPQDHTAGRHVDRRVDHLRAHPREVHPFRRERRHPERSTFAAASVANGAMLKRGDAKVRLRYPAVSGFHRRRMPAWKRIVRWPSGVRAGCMYGPRPRHLFL